MWGALLPSLISTGAGLLGSLFGKKRQQYTTTVDLTNPYIKKALRRADDLSQHGMALDTLNKIRQNILSQSAQEAQGLRTAAEQRMLRQHTPAQAMEQILGDISQRTNAGRLNALTNVDLNNERVKQEALRMYMQGAKGLTKNITEEQPAGLGYGQLLGQGLSNMSDYFTKNDMFNKYSDLMRELFGGNNKKQSPNGWFFDTKTNGWV